MSHNQKMIQDPVKPSTVTSEQYYLGIYKYANLQIYN